MPARGRAGIASIVWECAVKALVTTLVISILGGVALGILGNIAREMTPSAPPFLRSAPHAEATSLDAALSQAWGWAKANRLVLIFAAVFAGSLYGAWQRQRNPGALKETRFARAIARMSENWFEVLVLNAFGAWISALLLGVVLQFSLSRLVAQAVMDAVSQALFAGAKENAISDLCAWYGANKMKFNFWLLYAAAICDDLGLPNLKTLGRLAWRKLKARCRNGPLPV